MTSSPSVLLVESDLTVRNAVTTLLGQCGYAVECARTGVEAELRLRNFLPDLVVVELLLPNGSGLRVAELAKTRSDGRVPVVMLSGLTAPVHRDYALAAGVDVFLPKPFRASALMAAAGRLCPVSHPAPVFYAEAV